MKSTHQLDLARSAIQQMDFAQARKLLQNILKNDTQNIEAWLMLARVALEREEAIKCLEQVLALDPKQSEAQELLRQFQVTSKIDLPSKAHDVKVKKNAAAMSASARPVSSGDSSGLLLGPMIGSLTHSSVKLWGRTSTPATLYAWIFDNTSDMPVLSGQTELTPDFGCAGVVEVDDLKPLTEYRYALTVDKQAPPQTEFRSFKTAPEPGQFHSFQFAFGSCFLPGTVGPAGKAFEHIHSAHPGLSFIAMLGDQIYADEWKQNGLNRIAVNKDDYREVYRHTWSNLFFRELLKSTPVFMTLDDHEVDNDWHWRDRSKLTAEIPLYTRFLRWMANRAPQERSLSRKRVQAALQTYWEHQFIHTPGSNAKPYDFNSPDTFDYTFHYGGAAFFVMDTRTHRIVNSRQREILGTEQWAALEQWLLEGKDQFPIKFILTSSAFLNTFLGDFANERWSSFSHERDRLMKFISKHEIHGIYFLAGDLHAGHAISINLKANSGKLIPVWEFCASPFEQDTNYLSRLLTLRHPRHRFWQDHHVHFIVDRINYGVVTIYFNDPMQPSVHFDLHYLAKNDTWKTKSVNHVQG